MTHVKTQIRNGVIEVLKALPDFASAHSASRMLRKFQSTDFPLAIVSVAENVAVSGVNGTPGHRQLQRDMQISVTIGIHEETSDAEDTLDELSVLVEKTLAKPSSLGVGKLLFWRYNGSAEPTGQPTEDGLMLIQTLNFSCSVRTTDTDPTTII